MNIIEVIVENAGSNLSAYIEGLPVITVGNSLVDIKKNMQEAIDLYIESCKELSIEPVDILQGNYELVLNTDKL
ncbi:hypothetical protein M1P97_09080 [Parabacteroides sp. GYB001]|uniref:hypothetical protein n=1 Tax=Parabacteroides leei TaxID=2939491 RepID=UPI0020176E8A|nr:hypothetical protein [Parabacteroides leei]MCL3851437.1 hypothetical protein [Parabacteroides leei]